MLIKCNCSSSVWKDVTFLPAFVGHTEEIASHLPYLLGGRWQQRSTNRGSHSLCLHRTGTFPRAVRIVCKGHRLEAVSKWFKSFAWFFLQNASCHKRGARMTGVATKERVGLATLKRGTRCDPKLRLAVTSELKPSSRATWSFNFSWFFLNLRWISLDGCNCWIPGFQGVQL